MSNRLKKAEDALADAKENVDNVVLFERLLAIATAQAQITQAECVEEILILLERVYGG